MSFLAIDYGLRKIGLAISEGTLATPLPALIVKTPPEAKAKILTLLDLHSVETLVFGIPKPDSIGAEKFADDLAFSVKKLVKVDETMTTKLTKEKTNKKTQEDSAVAALLLQEYLDQPKGAEFAD